MRIAYLDCASGVSGDMVLGALIDAGVDLEVVQEGIDSLGLPSCQLKTETVKKQAFRALQLTVEHEPEHAHRHLHHIEAMITGSNISSAAQTLALAIFRRLAVAEAKVHGSTLEKVHFHEVGAVDSIADIVGAAIGLSLLDVDQVHCAPVPTGHGFIDIAHGRCSLPAPATAELLVGVPLAECDVEGELTTPTGAAIVAEVVDRFGPLPAMTVERIGYGAGQKDFAHANLLRLLIGETDSTAGEPAQTDQIVLLTANIDDTTGEGIGYASHKLREAGALDVAVVPLQMKKDRPGFEVAVQCLPADAAGLTEMLFMETSTLGVRRQLLERQTLPRRTETVDTPHGPIQGIVATLPDGSERFAPEYDACAAAAAQADVPLATIQAAAAAAWQKR